MGGWADGWKETEWVRKGESAALINFALRSCETVLFFISDFLSIFEYFKEDWAFSCCGCMYSSIRIVNFIHCILLRTDVYIHKGGGKAKLKAKGADYH